MSMASPERETLLPQDRDVFSEENSSGNHFGVVISPKGLRSYESISVSCGSSYSSWSDLSSPFGSELESTNSETTESEDEEFMSELSRQMAEFMLQDDDEDEEIQDGDKNSTVSSCFPENSASEGSELSVNWPDSKSSSVCYYNSPGFTSESGNPPSESAANVGNLGAGVNSDNYSTDEKSRPVQVYELKNQPQVEKQGPGGGGCSGYGGKRVKATDSTQQLHHHQQKEQKQNMQKRGKAGKHGQGKKNSIPQLPTPRPAKGMRAVFLGGPDRNGSTGTGVFLPSGAYTKSEPKKKSGCSTVLIPARVLQTLQHHFNTVGTMSPSSNTSGGSANLPWQNDVLARINGLLSQKKHHAEFHTRPPPPTYSEAETNHHPEVHLPQEWTY